MPESSRKKSVSISTFFIAAAGRLLLGGRAWDGLVGDPLEISGYPPKDQWVRMDEDRLVGPAPEVSGSPAETLVGNPL